ncbi:MAG: TIGR03564 family F420-dependent LLM class oxidoreductase [Myxococcota bacterium]
MRIGMMSAASQGPEGIDAVVAEAKRAEEAGYATLWVPNIMGLDAMTALAIAGRATQRIEVGTAVVPTYPRHPHAMAQQALSTAAACGGRFSLGIGLSHKIVIDDMLGMSYEKPARHMAEYLEVLGPLLRGESVDHKGELYRVSAPLQVPGATSVPLLVAALGPVMLKLAGRMSDGTITWMTGPKTLADHIIPKISQAASAAGRPAPRVVCGLPVLVARDVAAARETISKALAIYGTLPSYRAMLDREGVAAPGDVAICGDEAHVEAALDHLAEIGVTDFNAFIVPVEEGALERTEALIRARAGASH